MKKMLSLILCLATIFSSVAFCFPAIAADIEFGVETGKEQATLPAGTEDAALADDLSLPVIYDFEDGKVPDAFNLTNQNAKVAVSVVDKGEGKVLQIALAAQTMWLAGRVNFDITTGTLPAGLYRISVDFAAEEYPDSGLEFYIYSRTKTGGKLVSTKLTGENGLAVTEDRTVTVELEATEDLDTSTIQFAVKKPVTSEPLTYTLDNFKFEEIPVPVTVRFDGNGASGSQESISTETGATITLPAETTFTRDYYDFKGWALKADAAFTDAVSVYTVDKADLQNGTVTFYALWERIAGASIVTVSGASGYDGKIRNVDPRFPGAYYVLPSKLKTSSITLGTWADELNASAVEYDESNNILIVYPKPENVRPGATISFAAAETGIVTADGKSLLALPAVSYTLASSYAGIYDNLVPYGDAEGTYFPYFTSHGSAKAERLEDADGNRYARLTATKTENAWPHLGVNFYFENGATYKFTGRYRGNSLNMNVSFSAAEDMPYSKPELPLHSNKWNHFAGLTNSSEWENITFEFTINKNSDSDEGITIYSNPSGGKITEFDVDDFAVYKRMEVTYSEGTAAKLVSGKTAPETVGVYLDGSETVVKLAEECPYEPLDGHWTINFEKPWLDQYGNAYALGEKVDLAAVGGPLDLTPNLIADTDVFTVSFVCDGLSGSVAPVKVIAGKTLDMTTVENMKPTDTAKNFNGWSPVPSGDWRDALHGEVEFTKDTTLYPVISYNFDMAVANNREKWNCYNSKIRQELYHNSIVLEQYGNSNDVIISASGLSVPAMFYKGINLIVDNTYAEEGALRLAADDEIEGLYFGRTGEGASFYRSVAGKTVEITDDGYAVVYMNGCANKNWNGTIAFVRFDPFQSFNNSMAIRAVEFVPADKIEDNAEVVINGLAAPVTGEVAAATATDANGFAAITGVSWNPALVNGRFDETTVYTATVTMVPAAGTGKVFTPNTKVTIGGESCDVVYDAVTGVLTAKKAFPSTDSYLGFTMQISGKKEVSLDGNPVSYTVSFTSDAEIPDKTFVWSIEQNENDPIAEFTSDGQLTAFHDGYVTLRATSNYNPRINAELAVHILTPSQMGAIYYHAGTTDTVTGLPENAECYGKVILTDIIPTRADSAYTFLGWSLSDESAETVDFVFVLPGKQIDLYAVWAKIGVLWTFGNKGNHKLSSNVISRGDDYDEVKPAVGDYRIHMTNLNLDAQEYSTVIVRMSSTSVASTKIYYKTKFINGQGDEVTMGYDTNGYAYAEAQSMNKRVSYDGLDNFKNVVFDFMNDNTSNTAGKWRTAKEVVSIYVDPCKTAGQSFRISSILLCASPTVTFDANTAETVIGMPGSMRVALGKTLTVSETPVWEGHTFLGWSKTPTGETGVKKSFGIVGDITLYAIWSPVSAPKFDSAVSLRLTKPAGLRMRASLAQRVFAMEDDVEVGVMVTLDKNITGDFTYESGEAENYPILTGIGYSRVNGQEKVNKLTPDAEDGETASLTAVITGIPDTVAGYTSAFALRSYVTVGNNRYYGDTKTLSVAEAAARLKKNPDYADNDYVNHILDAAGTAETSTGKYLIVTPDEDGRYTVTALSPTTHMRTIYVHAWVDGSTKWIEVNKDAEIWPNIQYDIRSYVNKLATYTIEPDGRYTVSMLGCAYDDKSMCGDSYIGLSHDVTDLVDEEDSSITCLIERDDNEYNDRLIKIADRRYRTTGVDIGLMLNHNSRILIRNEYDNDGETVVKFVEYNANTLPTLVENSLANVQIVVSNNVNYADKENLVFYYAETSDGVMLADPSAEPEEPEMPETLPEDLSKILVVTPDEDGKYIADTFSPTTYRAIYVHAWVDGSTKWIEVDTDAEIYPKISDRVEEYVNKPAVYTVGEDGRYKIYLLGNAYSDKRMDEESYIGVNRDDTVLRDDADSSLVCYFERGEENSDYFTKYFGKRYTTTGINFNLILNENSVILIQNEYIDENGETVVRFGKYTVDTLSGSVLNSLKNVCVLVSNNPNYANRENLLLYYAETSDGEALDPAPSGSEEPEKPTEPETLPEDLSKILVVTPDEDGEYMNTVLNTSAGRMSTYVYAWVDGSTKWIEVDTDAEIYPKISDRVEEYVNKPAVYTVGEDGRYKIYLLGNAFSDKTMSEDNYIGLNKDLSELESDGRCLIERDGEYDDLLTLNKEGTITATGVDFSLVSDENTMVLIRNEYEDGQGDFSVDFYLFKEKIEPIENTLANVQMLVTDNGSADTKTLRFYYAETSDCERLELDYPTPQAPERIIKYATQKKDSSKKYYYEYTVYNPYTGETETIRGNKNDYGIRDDSRYIYGDVVNVKRSVSGLTINEKIHASGSVLYDYDLYWILDYDAEGGMIEVAQLPMNEEEAADVENGTAKTLILSVQNAAVSQIGNQGMSGIDIIRWGSFSKAAVDDLGSAKNTFKAMNSSYRKSETSDPVTVYAKCLKVYLSIDWADKNDHTCIDDKTGCNGTVSYASIVLNGEEPLYRCALK